MPACAGTNGGRSERTRKRVMNGESEVDAGVLGLRPHAPIDRRAGEAGGHRSRHPAITAAADISAHAGRSGIPRFRTLARVLYSAEGPRRLPVRRDPGG